MTYADEPITEARLRAIGFVHAYDNWYARDGVEICRQWGKWFTVHGVDPMRTIGDLCNQLAKERPVV